MLDEATKGFLDPLVHSWVTKGRGVSDSVSLAHVALESPCNLSLKSRALCTSCGFHSDMIIIIVLNILI